LSNVTEADEAGKRYNTGVKPFIAISLMIIPVLIAATVSYWPSHNPSGSERSLALFLPTTVLGTSEVRELAFRLPDMLSMHVGAVPGLQTKIAPTTVRVDPQKTDYRKIGTDYGANLLVLTAITGDAGLLQLNIQLVDPRTQRVTWSNAYQSPQSKY